MYSGVAALPPRHTALAARAVRALGGGMRSQWDAGSAAAESGNDQPDDGDGPLPTYFLEWMQHFGDPLAPALTGLGRLLRHMRESKVSAVSLLVVLVLAVADTLVLMKRGEPLSLRVPVRTCVAGYSCCIAQFILVDRKPGILSALRRVRRAARSLEPAAGDASKAAFAKEARRGRRLLWRVAPSYATFVTVGVLLTMLDDTESPVNSWIRHQSEAAQQAWGPDALQGALPAAARYAKWLFEVYAVSSSIACLFTLLLLEQAVHGAVVLLLEEVGQRLQDERRRGVAAIRRSVVLHLEVLAASADLNAVFGLLLPQYLLISVIMSMLSTVAVVSSNGAPDGFALSCSLYLFIFFVPMCVQGQRVEEASEAVGLMSYSGPWSSEAVAARRCRLQIMTSSMRPVGFVVPGLAALNRPTCGKVMRSWFQLVQILVNLRKR